MIAAIVPAAGRSERMGRPKLILPVGGATVIARVVAALRQGGAAPVVVVAPPTEAPGARILAEEAEHAGAAVVIADPRPADMRASFERGLDYLRRGCSPSAVVLAPGDGVGITPELVARLIARAGERPEAIIVPTWSGRRGHPIVLPWNLANEARDLPPGVGVNTLVMWHETDVVELEVTDPGTVADLDTPEDYRRWTEAAEA